MPQFNDVRARRYETTLANLREMFAEERQNLRDLINDPEWADHKEGAETEIAMLNRVQKDIFRLFYDKY